MYESSFAKITDKYFKATPWPAVEAIAPYVDYDHVFCMLYKEMYFRHIFARLTPTLGEVLLEGVSQDRLAGHDAPRLDVGSRRLGGRSRRLQHCTLPRAQRRVHGPAIGRRRVRLTTRTRGLLFQEPREAAMTQPNIDFSTFLLSLASSAMMHMGLVPDPSGQRPEVHLELAKQTIDMLAMLRDKTRGNLTPEEQNLFERVLHDVRVAYVEQMKQQSS